MRNVRFVVAATMAAASLSACATKGFVRKNLEAQKTAMTADMQRDLASERGERSNADSAIRGDVARVNADLAALRTELQALRTDFGAKITAMEGQVSFVLPVHFDFNNATVRSADQPALEKFADVVNKHYRGAQITVEGFADPAGSVSYNLALSQHRAESVRDFIATKGIDSATVKTVGYGKARLVRPGAKRDDAGAELNRRVTFVIETPGTSTMVALAAPVPPPSQN
jgi:peptidoglycan-associated lipoprotein